MKIPSSAIQPERRKIWPSRALFWSFVLYLISAASMLYIIYQLNAAREQSADISPWLNFFQPVCLLALGFIQFKLVKQYLDIKFNQFLARIYYEIWLMLDDNLYSLGFRRSQFTPWYVCELNKIIEGLIQSGSNLKQTLGAIKGKLARQIQSQRVNGREILKTIQDWECGVENPLDAAHDGIEHQKRTFNWYRFKKLASWTGVYSFVFIFLWFSFPIWITVEYDRFYAPPFTIGVILVIALALYLLLITFLSYFWVTLFQIKFIEHINEKCRRFTMEGDKDIFETQKKYGYHFFTSSLKALIASSQHNLDGNLDMIKRLKKRFEQLGDAASLEDMKAIQREL